MKRPITTSTAIISKPSRLNILGDQCRSSHSAVPLSQVRSGRAKSGQHHKTVQPQSLSNFSPTESSYAYSLTSIHFEDANFRLRNTFLIHFRDHISVSTNCNTAPQIVTTIVLKTLGLFLSPSLLLSSLSSDKALLEWWKLGMCCAG